MFIIWAVVLTFPVRSMITLCSSSPDQIKSLSRTALLTVHVHIKADENAAPVELLSFKWAH